MPDYSPAIDSSAQITNAEIEEPKNTKVGSILWQKGLHKTKSNAQSFQATLASPSISNQYRVSLNFGNTGASQVDVNTWIANCGVFAGKEAAGTQRFDFLCSEASLPGANFVAFEETGSRQGITETFPGMRSYTDLQLRFYVSSDYKAIRLFQEWINFINPTYTDGRSRGASPKGQYRQNTRSGFTRMRYPDSYKKEITITKFEKSYGYSDFDITEGKYVADTNAIDYNMVNAFPESMEAIPLSYNEGQVVQCTVNLKYDRFYVTQMNNKGPQGAGPNIDGILSDSSDAYTQMLSTSNSTYSNGENVTNTQVVKEQTGQ